MEIHNLMEDEVIRIIREIADEDARTGVYGYATTPECQMDAACFVLNRVPQQYVSSARGLTHVQNEFRENPQLAVDLVTFAHEGLRRVSTVQRSYYAAGSAAGSPVREPRNDSAPAHHFPAIRGRVFDCLTFAPMAGIEVWLKTDGSPTPMVNGRWQNPCGLVENTAGSYLFWPAPVAANEIGERRLFEFEIMVEETNEYETFHHFFKVESMSSDFEDNTLRLTRDYMLQDLFLVRR
ncbi:MAG TPA: late competence development ComFB family protein [Spirochaetia bacterium]|nr:late competence development ComFB family protein [Spirochaetia bacterium]